MENMLGGAKWYVHPSTSKHEKQNFPNSYTHSVYKRSSRKERKEVVQQKFYEILFRSYILLFLFCVFLRRGDSEKKNSKLISDGLKGWVYYIEEKWNYIEGEGV